VKLVRQNSCSDAETENVVDDHTTTSLVRIDGR